MLAPMALYSADVDAAAGVADEDDRARDSGGRAVSKSRLDDEVEPNSIDIV
jgi:hypothetical protein